MSGPGAARRRRTHAAPARAPSRFRGVSYGGWSFRERTSELRALAGRRMRGPALAVPPTVWGVRVDIHPLGLDTEAPPRFIVPRVPRGLREALEGLRELRARPVEGGWELFRDGAPVGQLSRPAFVPLTMVLPPPQRSFLEPFLPGRTAVAAPLANSDR